MSEEAMREEVAQAVEVAANKAAEEEISKLAEFESAIDETLASGYLDDTLTVTDADGVAQVLPMLDSEPISHLVEGLEAVGGSANGVRAHQRRRGGPQRSGIQAQRRGVAVAACTVRRHAYG